MGGDGGEDPTGGSSGSATGGGATGGSGGGMAGTTGSGGSGGGGGDEFPNENDPCAVPGALACAGPAQNRRFICKDGLWTRAESCVDELPSGQKQNCDRRSGACADLAGNCQYEMPGYQYASCPLGGVYAETCGPDLVSITIEYCELGCDNSTQRCRQPSADELVFDRVPPTQADYVFWPTPVIPVCFRDEGGELDSERAAIRDEIESTWGRYSSIAFSGWSDCSSSGRATRTGFHRWI